MTQTTFNKLYPNEYNQGLRYYPFAANLDRCAGSRILLCMCSKKNRRFKFKCI